MSRSLKPAEAEVVVVADVVDEEAEGTASTTNMPCTPPLRLPLPLLPQRPLLLRPHPLRHPLLASSSRNSRHAEVEVAAVDDAVDEVAESTATTTSTPKPPQLRPRLLLPQRLLPQLRPHPLRHPPLVNLTTSSTLSSANS